MGQYAHLATRPCLTLPPSYVSDSEEDNDIDGGGARADKGDALISISER